jgi:hypothetical protein
MKLLKHFDRINTSDYILYRLKKDEWSTLIDKLPTDFRQCYITDKALAELSTKAGITKRDFLKKYIVPDDPTIKSGDFGELLCYYAVIENFERKGFFLFGPKKWRWKNSRNVAAPGSDAILFHIADSKKPSIKDMLVTIESKMKAIKSNQHRMQDAVDGAIKDKKTRMVKTLAWLEEKYAREGDENNRKFVERFKDPATHGDYVKTFKAVAVVDSICEADEISKKLSNEEKVIVIIFSLEELKKAYENTHVNIIESV